MLAQPFFSDLHHVAYLRKRLWTRRTTGRAAVMVGAGFSRNGIPQVAGARPFPLWRQLVELLFDGLRPGYPDLTERQKLIDQAASGAGALTMAMEYEATFGRSALDNLIIGAIPDEEHSPGELHRRLLSLPWADVFTVNYDTLLERTRAQVYNRRYEVVVHLSDLPTTTQPRIIKLHGSLPATKPFIFTEEDFRRYPRQFAPFVNTVQQGMMENDFVLLGFSGDDPNFLAWLGWIRDEFLSVRPQVYLCGVLDVTSAQRLVLEKRGVTPIDLGPLFPKEAYPDNGSQRHSDAMLWLLQSLENGRGALVPLSWPHFPHLDATGTIPTQPAIGPLEIVVLAPEPPGYESEHPLPSTSPGSPETRLLSLIVRWERNRRAYPGWLVLPRTNRETLARYTRHWREPLAAWLATQPLTGRLRPLAELAWRLEYGLLLPDLAAEARLFRELVADLPWPAKPAEREDWTTIAFYWLRQLRYDYDHAGFVQLLAQLEIVAATSAAHRAHHCWEAATERLEHLDAVGARSWLTRWPDVPDNPAWDLRRAGLWAELDELDIAERYAAQALAASRARQPVGRVRIDMLSVEEAATWRLTQLREARRFAGQHDERTDPYQVSPDEWERQLLFKEYNCASDEVGELYEIIKGPVPAFQPAAYEEIDPYSGRRSYGRRMATQFSSQWVQPALDVPAIFEDSGQPMRLGFDTYRELAAAIRWLFDVAPHRALGLLIRTRNHALLDIFLDPARLAELPTSSLSALLEPALQTLEAALAGNEQLHGAREQDNVKLALRLMGRGAFRLTDDQWTQAKHLASRLWAAWPRGLTNRPSHDWRFYEEFTAGIVDRLSGTEAMEMLPSLLLTKPEPEFAAGALEHLVPEQLPSLQQVPEAVRASIAMLISWLDGDPAHRRAAGRRLFYLNGLGGLTPAEQTQFAQVLWAQASAAGVPEPDSNPRTWRLLTLPAPAGIEAAERVKQYLLKQLERATDTELPASLAFVVHHGRSLRYLLNNTALATAPGQDEFPSRYQVLQQWISWSKQEVKQLLRAVSTYFELVKPELLDIEDQYRGKPPGRSSVSGFDFDSISLFLRRVVLPHLTADDPETLQQVEHLIQELLRTHLMGRAALPALLAKLATPAARAEEYISLIRLGLLSYTNAAAVADGAEAVYCWVASVVNGALDQPYYPLLSELLLRLRMRGLPNTVVVAQWVLRLLQEAPQVLWPSYAEPLCQALRVLLTETTLPTWEERLLARQVTEQEQLFQRPVLAALAAEMAGLVAGLQQQHPHPGANELIAEWEVYATASAYPAVKRAWRRGRHSQIFEIKSNRRRKPAA